MPAARAIELTVTNPNGIKIAVLRNSTRAGVASFRLPLAQELDFGSYGIAAVTDGAEAQTDFEVDAYTLPKFEVNVTLSASYLLSSSTTSFIHSIIRPTTSVTGTVAATYTFGEAVIGSAQCVGRFESRWGGVD